MSTALIVSSDVERAVSALIRAKRSEHTRRAYASDWARWVGFCCASDAGLVQPTLDLAIRFRDALEAVLARATVRRALATLSFLYRRLTMTGIACANPFHPAILAWPPASEVGTTPMVPEDVAEAMIDHAARDDDRLRGTRDAAILRLLYDTGLRRAEVAQLRCDHVHLNVTEDSAIGFLTAVLKGGREADVYLPTDTVRVLLAWLRVPERGDSAFLFPGRLGGAINARTVNLIVAHRASAVGARGVKPHGFRAAYVTAAYDAGAPESEIQASVHHASAKMTQRYDRKRRMRGSAVAQTVADWRKKDRTP